MIEDVEDFSSELKTQLLRDVRCADATTAIRLINMTATTAPFGSVIVPRIVPRNRVVVIIKQCQVKRIAGVSAKVGS